MSLNDTASITLLTGLPGSGKSLRLVQFIVDTIEAGHQPDKDGETHPAHIFVTNVTGIGVEGITRWQDPTAWADLPVGATLIVDEAQDFFPRRRSGEPREEVRLLSKIRHYGVRLVLATQDPSYLDQHLLGLVGSHEHLLRMNGKDRTFIFRHNTVMENIRKPFKVIRSQYDHETWALPQKYFKFYKSAELHSIKYRMPALMKKALIFAPMSAVLAFAVWFMVFRDGYAHVNAGKEKEAEPGPAALATTTPTQPSARGSARAVIMTKEDYAQRMVPLVEGMPWTAPVFVDRPVQADPHVYCMAVGHNGQDSCSCETEQGTRFYMDLDKCYAVARWGEPYNPFKAPVVDSERLGRAEPVESDVGG